MSKSRAIKIIDEKGGLLVFPINNRAEPKSLWSELYPRSSMRWEWDESGDDRVARLWHLRTELSLCKEVVYSKWWKGRATFFSRDVFQALLVELAFPEQSRRSLSEEAQNLLRILEQESPLSTKALKKETGLRGRDHEGTYHRALKSLWERALIVGYGEVDDGAFPSLAIGASQLIFDECWETALHMKPAAGERALQRLFTEQPLFKKEFDKIKKALGPQRTRTRSSGLILGKDLFLNPRK